MFHKSAVFLVSLVLLAIPNLKAATPFPPGNPLKAWTATSSTVSNAVDTVSPCIASAYSGDPQGTAQPSTPGIAGAGLTFRGPAYATYIQVLSDNSTAKLQFYICTNQCALVPTNSTAFAYFASNYTTLGGTNIPVSTLATNQFGTNAFNLVNSSNVVYTNAVCVIRHLASDTYERNRIWGAFGTNVIFQYPPTTAIGAGDIVYVYTPTAAYVCPTNGGTLVNAKQYSTTFSQGGPPGVASGAVPNTPFLMEETGGTLINTNAVSAAGGYLP